MLFYFSDFVGEAYVTYKRKYTDLYPKRSMYVGAKVRNVIFSAIGDRSLDEDEIKKLLVEIGADDRWHQRHRYFFIITKEGKKKRYRLSKKAKKMHIEYSKKIDINEEESINAFEQYLKNKI